MASWNAKLSLAMAMRDAWGHLDLKKYLVGSATRVAKAMKLVAQTVRRSHLLFLHLCCAILTPAAFRVASKHG